MSFHWQANTNACTHCERAIGYGARHHCRGCGQVFCEKCAFLFTDGIQPVSGVPFWKRYDAASRVRVCDLCYIKKQQNYNLKPSVVGIETIDHIRRTLPYVGAGACNRVHRSDNFVYKIPLNSSDKINARLSYPPRIVRIWNELYHDIHDGKFKQFATARLVELQGVYVVELPFIDGHPLDFARDTELINRFKKYLRDNFRREIIDVTAPGNLRQLGTGEVLPIDLDYACDRERRDSYGSDYLVRQNAKISE